MDQLQVKKLSEFVHKKIDLLKLNSKFSKKDFAEGYMSRYHLTQDWFKQCKSHMKICFLQQLGEILNTNSLNLILNSLYSFECKDQIYVQAQFRRKKRSFMFIMNKEPRLDEIVLHKLFSDAISNFKALEDFEQYSVVTGLSKLCDSSVLSNVYKYYRKILQQKKRNLTKTIQKSSINKPENKTEREKPKKKNKQTKKDKNIIDSRKINYQPIQNVNELKNEYSRNVFIKSEKWTSVINAYKQQLLTCSTIDIKPKKQKGKLKNKKEEAIKDTIDQIQMLPVWINKKIISYLKSDNIQNLTKVDKYWNFIIKEIKEDKHCQADMKKIIFRMKKK